MTPLDPEAIETAARGLCRFWSDVSRPGRTPEEIEAHVNDNWPIFFGRARAGLEEMVSSGWEIRRRDEADKLNLPPQGEENT